MDLTGLELIFATSLLGAALVTPLFRALAFRLRLVDRPGHRKIHKRPVPYLGGPALFSALALGLAVGWVWFARHDVRIRPGDIVDVAWVLGFTAWGALAGLLDDAFDLSARLKLVSQMLGVLVFAVGAYRFGVVQVPGLPPVHLGILAAPVTAFWMLAIINAVNLVDGLDGLAGSVTAAVLLTLAAAAFHLGNPALGILALAGLGATLGFLLHNWTPARIYLGDAGSCGLGSFLAASLLVLGHHGPGLVTATGAAAVPGQPFPFQLLALTLIVSYPAAEVTLSVVRRVFKARPIGAPDRDHLHHRLRALGWSNPAVCAAAAGCCLLSGGAVFAALDGLKGLAGALAAVFALTIGVGLARLGVFEYLHPGRLRHSRPHFRIAHLSSSLQLSKLALAQNLNEVLTLTNQTCVEFGVEHYEIILKGGPAGEDWSCRWHQPGTPASAETGGGGSQALRGHSDTARIAGRGQAHWFFESHPGHAEEDLDVEYHTLMAKFMRAALARVADLQAADLRAAAPADGGGILAGGARVNASLLKRRTARQRNAAAGSPGA